MKKIIAVTKNTLQLENKKALTKEGYIIIECDDPTKIRVINSEQNMDTNDWFMAALYACTTKTPTTKAEYFVNTFPEKLKMFIK